MADDMMKKLDYYLTHSKELVCDKCHGKMGIVGSGKYRCEKCGYEYMDDFGKVKQYIDEHGVSSIADVEYATGVDNRTILKLLRQGRVEIPDGSPVYLQCEKCGCDIRYGRYCPDCIRTITHDFQSIYVEVAGERPTKKENNGSKMHFLGRDER